MSYDKDFAEEACKQHNLYRSHHQVGKLKVNKDICIQAQTWADHLAKTNTFTHSNDVQRKHKGEAMGENIALKFTSSGDDFTGQQVTDQWYSEIERYNFTTNSGPRTGHFTQVVWKDCKEFGIGKGQTRDGKWIVVANYCPAGNWVGKNAENVFNSKDGKPLKPTPKEESKGGPLRNLFGKKDSDTSSNTTTTTTTTQGGRTVTKETKEVGPGGYTKTVITETTTGPDGQKRTTTREVVKQGEASGFSSDFDSRFKKMGMGDDWDREPQATGTTTKTYTYTSGSADDKDKKDKEKKPQKMKDFIDDVVKAHNKYRKKHGKVGDLKHNKELDVLAQRWADHLAATSVLKHSNDTYKGDPLGENVATRWSSAGADYTGQEVVDQWYDEVSKFDFARGDFKPGTGHFTQVVWKGSKELGVGKAFGKDGRVYCVCNYYPAGNVVGQFRDNVHPEK